ncbi:Glucose/mannose transporter GlcP [compost metagenome]
MKRLVVTGFLFYLLMGCIKVTVASVLTELLPLYGREYSEAGTLILLEFTASLAGLLLQPLLAAYVSKKLLLHVSVWGIAVSYIAIGLLPPWFGIITAVAVAGVLGGIIDAVIGGLILQGIKGNAALAMSKLEVGFGLGSLLFPLLVGALITVGRWNLALFAVAGYAVSLSVFIRFLRYGEAEPLFRPSSGRAERSHPAPAGKMAGRGNRLFPFLMLLFVLYGAMDIGLNHYLPSMMLQTGMATQASAPFAVTVFWIAMVAGRLISGHEAERIGYRAYLLIHWSAMALFLSAFALNRHAGFGYALIVLMGLSLSGLFAITLVNAKAMMPSWSAGHTSLLMASCSIGGGLFSQGAGFMLDRLPLGYLMWSFALVAALTLGLYLFRVKEKRITDAESAQAAVS